MVQHTENFSCLRIDLDCNFVFNLLKYAVTNALHPLDTFNRCKGTFCERYSSILFAIAGPMPGNASSSLAVAVLIFILLPRNNASGFP